jgi:hypothetical protein
MDRSAHTAIEITEIPFEPLEPIAEAGAAGSPPRRPPTAVGVFSPPPGSPGPGSVDLVVRGLLHGMEHPVRELDLPIGTITLLERAGLTTLGHLLGLSSERMIRLRVDPDTQRRVQEWRREVGLTR